MHPNSNTSSESALDSIKDISSSLGLDDEKIHIDLKKGNITLTGYKDDAIYTITVSADDRISDSATKSKKIAKDAMASEVMRLLSEGYSQTEAASILGVSQVTISQYYNNL